MDITGKINELRAEKAWSIAELSRRCKIPTVSLRVMLSRDNPNNYNVKSLMRIADSLGTTVAFLTSEQENDLPALSKKQRKEISKAITLLVDDYLTGKLKE
jgi:transcriptional regulator with XRE-family HTH domain